MEVQDSSPYATLTKVGGGPFTDIDPRRSAAAREDANRLMWKMILAATGLGLVGGSTVGLARLLSGRKGYEPNPTYQPVGIMLPKKKKPTLGPEKSAKDGPIMSTLQNVTRPLYEADWGSRLANMIPGREATRAGEVPLMWALGLPLSAAGLYGGWQLSKGIADRNRKSELDEELAEARRQYAALVRQSLQHKEASDDNIEAALDELADAIEKRANPEGEPGGSWWPQWSKHLGNYGLSMYLPYAVLAAVASGKLSYDFFKKRNPEAITEEALRRRAKERFGGMTPIYLEPSTQPV